jgi:hypothetical protein
VEDFHGDEIKTLAVVFGEPTTLDRKSFPESLPVNRAVM